MEAIGRKHGTDKIEHHEYHRFFEPFIEKLYGKEGSILEIGMYKGASLKMWLELFPKCHIYGADIGYTDKGDRFTIFKTDQSKKKDLDLLARSIQGPLHFINDDGSHIPEHQLLTFNTLFPKLEDGGVYIIEDIETSYWVRNEIYGYQTRYGYKHPKSIVEIFKDVADGVNSEFAGKRTYQVEHIPSIQSITFSRNCIIIVKQKPQPPREYRLKHCV